MKGSVLRVEQLASWRRASALGLFLATTACVVPMRYTSLDLALLPCENVDSSRFFEAVEFNQEGALVYPHQREELDQRFSADPPVTDLVFFLHGWNKNPSSAELDYQNFLCRLHTRIRPIGSTATSAYVSRVERQSGLLVVGIFWPSTITNRAHEPALLKPTSYYRIRNRADTIAASGLTDLLASLTPVLQDQERVPQDPEKRPLRLHLIGHSFGARMMLGSLLELHRREQLVPLLEIADSLNVVLLNAAMPATGFDWIAEAVAEAQRRRQRARLTQATNSYLFNVHSFQDSANRVLFRLASTFNDDPAGCGAGACGVPGYVTVCVDAAGKLDLHTSLAPATRPPDDRLNVWNIDASSIVFDHTDIYKGRVATLVADLLYDEDLKQRLPPGDSGPQLEGPCIPNAER